MSKYKILNSKNIFLITLIVISLTVLAVWLFGLGSHHTIFENSIVSTTILSLAFFLFITIGLYNGIKIKHNLGKITDHIDRRKNIFPESIFIDHDTDVPDVGDGIIGVVLSILLWFVVSLIVSFLFWAFGNMLWIVIITFIAMLYWIFFRALRLVFKKSSVCKGNFFKSLLYGFSFTILYNFWIYMIIFMTHKIF
ncbi:MAG: hypothetical protein EOO44_01245 [Flavobacterium sp.]|nr:MAG: hypothetical protein EOO44_01245 [Flavobacterium sp.]